MKRYDHLERVHDSKIPPRRDVTNAFPILLESNVCTQFTTPQHNIFTNCLQPVHNARSNSAYFHRIYEFGSACRTGLLIFCTEVAACRIKSLSETRHFYGVEQTEYTL
jgi:hypothetical protein